MLASFGVLSMPEPADYLEELGEPPSEPPSEPAIEAPAVETQETPEVVWEEETVRGALMAVGAAAHKAWGIAERDWALTQKDLNRIAPPLTRVANRIRPVAALAPAADPLLIAAGFAVYGLRSAVERSEELRRRERDAADPLQASTIASADEAE